MESFSCFILCGLLRAKTVISVVYRLSTYG